MSQLTISKQIIALVIASLVLGASVTAQDRSKAAPSKEATKKTATPKKADAKKSKVMAIVGATIYPVSQARIRRGTILWQDGKILELGSEIDVPEGAEVIDGTGLYVCPGFVSLAAAGVGVSRVDGNFKHSLDPYNFNLRMSLAHGITTINALNTFAGSGFGGDFPVRAGTGSAILKMTHADLAGMLVREPSLNYFSLPTRQIEINLHNLRKSFKSAAKYLKDLEEATKKKAKPPKMPKGISAYVNIIKNERPTSITPSNDQHIEVMFELAEEYGFDVILSEPNDAWKSAADIAARGIPVMVKSRGADFNFGLEGSPLEKDGMIPIRRPQAFNKAGVLVGILPYRKSPSLSGLAGRDLTSLVHDAAFAVRGGMSEDDALRAITLGPAQILKIDDRVGSLEKGKDADILLMSATPLDYKSFVLKAFINGKEYYDRKKSRLFSTVPVRKGSL